MLGIINGGLGLHLADNTTGAQKGAYIAVAVIMAAAYVGSQVWWYWRVKQAFVTKAQEKGRELDERLV